MINNNWELFKKTGQTFVYILCLQDIVKMLCVCTYRGHGWG